MTTSPEHVWQDTLDQLQLQMTKATFDTWVKNTRVVHQQGQFYTIGVRDNYAKAWLENRLHDTINRVLESMVESPVEINFVVLEENHETPATNGQLEMTFGANNGYQTAQKPPSRAASGSAPHSESSTTEADLLKTGKSAKGNNLKLRSNYTFESFIVGASNRLAHAASLAVAEQPGEAHNPLFLYGGVGLGKTHLLHAVAHKAIQNQKRVIYVTSETFTNDFINAIQRNSNESFRAYYRNTDFLLIDDIQFIAGKESTQEEFFHTFNDIHAAGGQIVLTSDRLPRAIPTLEDRLSSRFEWGLLADVQAPDLEMRLAILRSKAAAIGTHVPDDVTELIARRAQNNIRELEGALNKVVAHAALSRAKIDIEQAKAALEYLVTRRESITIEMVIEVVADFYNLSLEEITGSGRSKRLAAPRQVAMYLAREETKASLPQVGEALGGRDHTTIMYGYEKIAKLVEQDEKIRRDIMQIRETLYQSLPAG